MEKEEALREAFRTYQSYLGNRNLIEAIYTRARLIEELNPLFVKLEDLLARQRAMFVSKADKLVPIDIGNEDLRITSALDDIYTAEDQTRRAQAAKLAKRLYSIYHPDKSTGDAITFSLVRRCAKEGDLEALYLFRKKEGVDDFTVEEVQLLNQKLKIRASKFQGSASYQVAQSYISNRQKFITDLSDLLNKRIQILELQLLGMNPKSSLEI
jgi:hypothetical protein